MTKADDYKCRVEYIASLIKLVAAEHPGGIFYTAQKLKDAYDIDEINKMDDETLYTGYCTISEMEE